MINLPTKTINATCAAPNKNPLINLKILLLSLNPITCVKESIINGRLNKMIKMIDGVINSI